MLILNWSGSGLCVFNSTFMYIVTISLLLMVGNQSTRRNLEHALREPGDNCEPDTRVPGDNCEPVT